MKRIDSSENYEFLNELNSLFSLLIPTLVTIFSCNVLANKLKIRRDQKIPKVYIESATITINKDRKKPYKRFLKMELSKKMSTFFKILANDIPHANKNAFIENSQYFRIEQPHIKFYRKIINFFKRERIVAFYQSDALTKYNKIVLLDEEIDKHIYHEFLHMASTYYTDYYYLSGFTQNSYTHDNPSVIGRGLNEGYTTLLTERYFEKYGAQTGAYVIPSQISALIEIIVGRKNMETWYFSADLISLYREMTKYMTYDEFMRLLNDIDILMKYAKYKSCFHTLEKIYERTIKFLTDIIIKKINTVEESNTINTRTAKLFIKSKLISIIAHPIESHGHIYKAFDEDEIIELFNQIPKIMIK